MSKEAKVISGIGALTLIILFGSVFLLSSNKNQLANSNTSQKTILKKNNNHKIASDSAKVTVVEFADFQCPACGAVYPQIKQILRDYKDQINFVYRHFPLPQHQNGTNAAKAAEAAGEQGKFWEMSELLFTKQLEWSDKGNAKEIFSTYAKDLQLNSDEFNKSLNSNKFEATINLDKEDGISLGVNSTPTIFINSKKLVLPPTYANIIEQIKAELTK